MRKGSLVTAGLTALAVLAVSACKGKETAMNDDLAKDVALASTSDGLSLAPKGGAQSVVSAVERSPEARPKVAHASRSTRPSPHRTPHRDRVPQQSAEVAAVSSPAPAGAPSTSTPSVATTTTVNDAPAPEAPRPRPVDVAYPSTGSGNGTVNTGRNGGGIGLGTILGAIGGAVLRGGVVDGDACDPRSDRRRGEGVSILVNRRGPVLRGTF